MEAHVQESGTIIGKEGVEIFYRKWIAEKPKGLLVIAHGVGEHSDRYNNIVSQLQNSNITIYAIDHRGHGKSGGKRGHTSSFDNYIFDLKQIVDLAKKENENLPIALLGHSMGGVIAFKYNLSHSQDLDGLIISSPGFIPAVDVPSWKKQLGNIFSSIVPTLSMPTGIPSTDISHDSDVVEAYDNDPMVTGKVSARWYTEFTKTSEECLNRAPEIQTPFLIFHGKDDKIASYKGSEIAFEKVSSPNKKIYLFDGLYHETMNETLDERNKVLKIVEKWITTTLNTKKKATVKKTTTKKTTTKKTAAKKTTTKKTAAKKTTAKKTTTKKATTKKAAVKKTTAKKATTKKAAVKKTTAKKATTKKTTVKKTTTKK